MTTLDFAVSRKNTGGAGACDSIRSGDAAKRFEQFSWGFCVVNGEEYERSVGSPNSRLRHRLMGSLRRRLRGGTMRGLSGAGANHDAGTIRGSPRWGQERLLRDMGGDFSRKSRAKDRAPADLAGNVDFTRHRAHQSFDDVQPEPGAGMLLLGRIDLIE